MLDQDADRAADLELVRRVLADEAPAAEAFARRMRCIPAMIALRNLRCGSPFASDEIHDLAQETLVRVWRRLPTYAGLSRLESWVYPFCGYALLNALRARDRRPLQETLDDETPGAEATPPAFELEHVHMALERIDATEADVVRLKHFEDLTFEAIGERLGIPANTAKGRYYRALRRLHTLLAVQGNGDFR